MNIYPPLYHQLMKYLRQYSHYSDKRHLMTLSWMVMGVLLSYSLLLPLPYLDPEGFECSH